MTALAPTLEAFFTERLMNQKRASAHTVGAYRDTFRLLLGFAQRRTAKAPLELDFADLDVDLVTAFLDHLEHERHNSVRSRNARLAAIHSMYRFAGWKMNRRVCTEAKRAPAARGEAPRSESVRSDCGQAAGVRVTR